MLETISSSEQIIGRIHHTPAAWRHVNAASERCQLSKVDQPFAISAGMAEWAARRADGQIRAGVRAALDAADRVIREVLVSLVASH